MNLRKILKNITSDDTDIEDYVSRLVLIMIRISVSIRKSQSEDEQAETRFYLGCKNYTNIYKMTEYITETLTN
jgi:hypothetical protein